MGGLFQGKKVGNVSRITGTEFFDGLNPLQGLGAGDSRYIPNFLALEEAFQAFEKLYPNSDEIKYWQMYHMSNKKAIKKNKPMRALARIKGVQGVKHDDMRPLYRFSGLVVACCV